MLNICSSWWELSQSFTCKFTSGIKEVLLRLGGHSYEQSRWAGSAAVGAQCHGPALPASFQLALCSLLIKITVIGTLQWQQDSVVSLSDKGCCSVATCSMIAAEPCLLFYPEHPLNKQKSNG